MFFLCVSLNIDFLLCSRYINISYVNRYNFPLSFSILLPNFSCVIKLANTSGPSLILVELIGILALFLTLVNMLLVILCIVIIKRIYMESRVGISIHRAFKTYLSLCMNSGLSICFTKIFKSDSNTKSRLGIFSIII